MEHGPAAASASRGESIGCFPALATWRRATQPTTGNFIAPGPSAGGRWRAPSKAAGRRRARTCACRRPKRVDVDYVRELSWSAFTRYGRRLQEPHPGQRRPAADRRPRARSRVSRVVSRPPHDRQPARRRDSAGRVEFLVQPLFSPQSLLHEAASSLAGRLAFPEPARIAFERDELFPLAGLDPAERRPSRARRASGRRAPRRARPTSRADTSTAASTSARRRGARARRPDAVRRRDAEIPEPIPHATPRPTRSAGTRCSGTSTAAAGRRRGAADGAPTQMSSPIRADRARRVAPADRRQAVAAGRADAKVRTTIRPASF